MIITPYLLYNGNSCKTLVGVHEMHGRLHPNLSLATICWLIGLPNDHTRTHTPLVAGN